MRIDVTESDRARVAAAIKRAERETSGEVVVVVARRSDDYLHVPLHIAAAAALALPILSFAATWAFGWLPLPVGLLFAYQLMVFIAVALALSVPPLRFAVTPKRLMHKHAHRHAATQFLALDLHTTASRTGVLIFVSLLERYCEIVADTAVAAEVSDATWQDIIDDMLPEIRSGHLAAGLERAVSRCGALLARHFPPGARNPDELPDHMIVI
jgi:putative membrane protein